jgi:hypothetical protein
MKSLRLKRGMDEFLLRTRQPLSAFFTHCVLGKSCELNAVPPVKKMLITIRTADPDVGAQGFEQIFALYPLVPQWLADLFRYSQPILRRSSLYIIKDNFLYRSCQVPKT